MIARPKLVRITDQMKEWSVALDVELSAWPGVTSKRMFGMKVYFRRGTIFGALPLTRSFVTPTSIAFKLYRKMGRTLQALKHDPLIVQSAKEDPKWILLELRHEKDLSKALQWYQVAYRTCLSKNNSPT